MSQDKLRDLCAEAVAVEGTGAATFLGAMRGHRSFAEAYAGVLPITGVNLKIEEANAQGYIVRWENSTCTVSETGFTRGTCISSSNNNEFEEFSAGGYKRAFVFIPVADVGGGAATGAVRYDVAQSLDAGEKTQGQTNLGGSSTGRAVFSGDAAAGITALGAATTTQLTAGLATKPSLIDVRRSEEAYVAQAVSLVNCDLSGFPGLTEVDGVTVDYSTEIGKVYLLAGQTDTDEIGAYLASQAGLTKLPTFAGAIAEGAHAGEYWVCGTASAIQVVEATGGGMSIGGAVTGGTAWRVPFIGAGSVLDQEADFNYDAVTHSITLGTLNVGGNDTYAACGIAARGGYTLIESVAGVVVGYDTSSSFGVGGIAGTARFEVHPQSTTKVGQIIQLPASAAAAALQVKNIGGTVITQIKVDGSLQPASLADAAATNNSTYLSTDSGKLSYKDAGGTVHALHA